MIVLTLRTDKPESELGLYMDEQNLVYETWPAHRQLAETLHAKIATLLQQAGKEWEDIEGIVVYRGPGSFTGLRIGISVANALAASYQSRIVGATGDDWKETGIQVLQEGGGERMVVPEYGAPVHITAPKK